MVVFTKTVPIVSGLKFVEIWRKNDLFFDKIGTFAQSQAILHHFCGRKISPLQNGYAKFLLNFFRNFPF